MIVHLLKQIYADPFEYAFGLIMVILAVGWVVRTVREQLGNEDD